MAAASVGRMRSACLAAAGHVSRSCRSYVTEGSCLGVRGWSPGPAELRDLTERAMPGGAGWPPGHQGSVIMRAWPEQAVYQQRYAAAALDPAWAHLRFSRVTSRRDVRTLLDRARPLPRGLTSSCPAAGSPRPG